MLAVGIPRDAKCILYLKTTIRMARKKSSVLDDLVDIAAQLPWKAGVGLAVVAYFILHYFATRVPLTMNPAELKALGKTVGDSVTHGVGTMLASVLQYIVPLAFLVGAFISFSRQRRQSELHAQVATDPAADALEKMSWREFEGLVAETFRRQGYRVVERGGDGPDGGVDLELHMGSDKYLVQCKQWKSHKVGVATVRELYGVMTAERAVGAFVVASGAFTDEAKSFADGRAIKLFDARKLRSMIGQVPSPITAPEQTMPACPKCGSEMVRRTAKKGANAGNQFWGCSRFPSCTGIRS
ncbi:restriction endonuclease [Azonexus sp.]|uniref:restriction endonuclease n=1 Tax=Azonexus sp. TaxID=1872668 RepID=UPI0027B96DF7|nr:restriction endonuclease [Azonexus sp.]